MYDAIEFQIEGVDVIKGAESYNDGIETLIETYKKIEDPKEQEAARGLLTEYGSKLRQKFKQDYYSFDEAIQYAPVKVSDILGEDDDTTLDVNGQVNKVTEWEKANLKYLDETSDPDQLAVKDSLKFSIETVASAARRDAMGNRTEDSYGGYVKDKFFRVYSGAVSGFENLTDANLGGKAAFERSAPSMDESFVSDLAYGAGTLTSMVGAGLIGTVVAGPKGGLVGSMAVGTAQGVGEVRQRYQDVLRDTGLRDRATTAAAIETVGQALQVVPTGLIAGKVTSRLGSRIMGKATDKLGNATTVIGGAALSEAVTEGTGQVFSNVAEGVGYGTEIDFIEGVGRSAAIGGILSGGLAGVGYGAERALINNYEKKLKDMFEGDEYKDPTDPSTPLDETKIAEATLREAFVNENKFEGDWKDKFFNTDGENSVVSQRYEPANDPYRQDSKQEVPWQPTKEDNASFWQDPVVNPEATVKTEPVVAEIDPNAGPVSISMESAVRNRNEVVRQSPGRLVYTLAKAVAGDVNARNYLAGALGNMINQGTNDKSKNKINVLKALGADPNALIETMAHEVGHAVDFLYSQVKNRAFKSVEPIIRKMHAVKSLVDGLSNETNETIEIVENFEADAVGLSKLWRGDWEGQSPAYQEYRANKKEIFADVFSALMYNPEFVKDNYPDVYKAFEYGLSQQPEVEAAWNNLNELIHDPVKTLQYHYAGRREAAIRQGRLNQEAIAKSQDAYQKRNSFLKALEDFYQQFFSTDRVISAAIKRNRNNKKVADELRKNQQNIKAVPYLRDAIARKIVEPIKGIQRRLATSKFQDAIVAFNDYLWINKVKNERTRTMENIRQNFDKYAVAALWLITPSNINFKGQETNLDYNSAVRDAINQGDPEALITALAQMNIVFSTAENVSLKDFQNQYPDNPKKALDAYNLAKARSMQRKQSDLRVHVEGIVKEMDDGVLKETLTEILAPTALNVRRLLVNDSLDNIFDADQRLEAMQEVYGKEGMDFFKKESLVFYDAINSMMGFIADSHIFPPDVMDRLRLNQGAYVTNMVLKHYEGDSSVSGTVRAAMGSLEETGNEVASTTAKMIATIERANRQNAANHVVEVAIRIGEDIEHIPVRPGDNIFDKQVTLASKDRNKDVTYVIAYNQGKPSLFKIGNKNYRPMIESPYLSSWVVNLSNMSRAVVEVFLTRGMLTVFSPKFVVSEKMRNTKNEAMWANSLVPRLFFAPFSHTDPKLRKIDKQSREWFKTLVDFQEKGIPLPKEFAEILDLNFLSTMQHGRYNTDPLSESSSLSVTEAMFALLDPQAREALDKTRSWDDKVRTAVDKFLTDVPILGSAFYKPIKWGAQEVGKVAIKDEVITKLNGFQIAKMLGKTDAEAAVFANLNFGTPDSMGGGSLAPVFNNAFMFFRAQFNGHRMLARMLDPRGDHRYAQVLARGIFPKLMLTPVVGAAVIGMLFGEEEKSKWEKILSMIPSWDLMSKDIIPWSLTDADGNIRTFGSVKASEIDRNWRVNYIGIPHPRELALLASILVPGLEEVMQGELQTAFNKSTEAAADGLWVQIPQIAQYFWNMVEIARNENPTDFYRRKGILPPDIAAAGSLHERSAEYMKYAIAKQLPGIMNYNPYKAERDYDSVLETLTSDIPVISPLARSIFNTSNYGNYERNKDLAADRQAILDNAKYNMKENSKELHKLWARDNKVKASIGKEEFEKQSSSESLARSKTISTWYYKHYRYYLPLIRQAYENGDDELVERYAEDLERYTTPVLEKVRPSKKEKK